jgi:hypothetical protein
LVSGRTKTPDSTIYHSKLTAASLTEKSILLIHELTPLLCDIRNKYHKKYDFIPKSFIIK